MNDLTAAEEAIFQVLRKGKEVSLDDIMEHIGAPSRHSVVVRIKYLAAKLAPHGWIVSKTTGIGRGRKAAYKIEKKF